MNASKTEHHEECRPRPEPVRDRLFRLLTLGEVQKPQPGAGLNCCTAGGVPTSTSIQVTMLIALS